MTASVCFARDLISTPSNDMTPTHLAKAALSLKRKNLFVKVLNKRDAERARDGSISFRCQGSNEPPKFIVLEYKGLKADR